MGLNEFFQFSLFENSAAVSLTDALVALALSCLLGVFISLVYRAVYAGVMFSRGLAGSLVAMTMITAMAILAVTSNAVLTLGMVGALSIVRFRAAIKEPLDIAFLFWAIIGGIVIGAGMIPLAAVGSLLIAGVLLFYHRRGSEGRTCLLIVTCADPAAERAADDLIRAQVKKAAVKSKSAREGRIEITYDVLLKENDTRFVTRLSQLENVADVVLTGYNGDMLG